MADVSLTWLGHAAFRIDSPGGKRIYIDPFLSGNPKCPDSEREPERADFVALTHGHSDHVGDTIALLEKFSPTLIAQVELQGWLAGKGADVGDVPGINKGGSRTVDEITFTLVNAFHSSSSDEGEYLGEAAGLVIRLEDGFTFYFAGDTCVFGDMQLIGRIYQPDVAVLPIGDHFTMGPKEASVALELLGVKRCVPCHYGTFPLLHGTPEQLRELASGVEVIAPQPGETATLGRMVAV
jgi:L-ascorbate metabolism protein UlaG (beta-lactamase superfamily)